MERKNLKTKPKNTTICSCTHIIKVKEGQFSGEEASQTFITTKQEIVRGISVKNIQKHPDALLTEWLISQKVGA